MARRNRRGKPITLGERARIEILAIGTYYHHRAIAKAYYGKGRMNGYVPSDNEVRRVSTILRQAGISTRDGRNGDTDESRRQLRSCLKIDDLIQRRTIEKRLKRASSERHKKKK